MFRSFLGTSFNVALVHIWLFVLRVSAGSFMLTHGYPKLMKVLDGNLKFSDPYGIGQEPSLLMVVFAEVFCSVLIVLGLFTRLASIPLIFAMFTAAFIANAGNAFAKKEMALLYMIIFFTLLILGGGKYSFDRILGKGKRR